MRITFYIVLSVFSLFSSFAGADQKSDYFDMAEKQAKIATPMNAEKLSSLYAGHSWIWDHGAGYFSADGKHFTAWSQKGANWSYAEGDWYTGAGGKICMRALWYTKQGYSPSISCFLHRERDGVIYQKKSLGGKWYIFSQNPPKPDDAIFKLQNGDYVHNDLERLKAIR